METSFLLAAAISLFACFFFSLASSVLRLVKISS
jgi:hypothetical protein